MSYFIQKHPERVTKTRKYVVFHSKENPHSASGSGALASSVATGSVSSPFPPHLTPTIPALEIENRCDAVGERQYVVICEL